MLKFVLSTNYSIGKIRWEFKKFLPSVKSADKISGKFHAQICIVDGLKEEEDDDGGDTDDGSGDGGDGDDVEEKNEKKNERGWRKKMNSACYLPEGEEEEE